MIKIKKSQVINKIKRDMVSEILVKLESQKNEEKAHILKRFFKTGHGQYGEGDVFLGITVPILRKLAREYTNISLETTGALLTHPFHEARLLALLVLIRTFSRGTAIERQEIFDIYLAHTRFINNWDLVDLSAPHIVGAHLADQDRHMLTGMADSQILWERRIAIISTFHFIRNGEFEDTLTLSERLLRDREDLIHKAVGWMLREVGKRNQILLESWLKSRYQQMPRTMLRYAIEKFPPDKRLSYLTGSL